MEGKPVNPIPPVALRRGLVHFLRLRPTPDAAVSRAERPRGRFPWVLLIVTLGLALRTHHFLGNPPLWHDEAAQIQNALDLDLADLLGPLYYSEACPPLFLAAEKAVVALLGDSPFALRLLPFLASCAVMVGLVLIGRLILPRSALIWLALVLAGSDRLLWHCCEAKPYAVDTLVATGLLALFVRVRADGDLRRLLAALALASPLLVFLSFPACFLLG